MQTWAASEVVDVVDDHLRLLRQRHTSGSCTGTSCFSVRGTWVHWGGAGNSVDPIIALLLDSVTSSSVLASPCFVHLAFNGYPYPLCYFAVSR